MISSLHFIKIHENYAQRHIKKRVEVIIIKVTSFAHKFMVTKLRGPSRIGKSVNRYPAKQYPPCRQIRGYARELQWLIKVRLQSNFLYDVRITSHVP